MKVNFDPITKKAALFSGLLHLSVLLFLVLGVVFSSLFARKEEPYIFEMVALPESAEIVDTTVIEPFPQLSLDLPEFEPVEIPEPEPPEPEPEPVVETPPPPRPVEQTPPPVPVEKPKPKIISREDWIKEHGKPEAPTTPPKPKPITPRKIDTSQIEKNLRQTIMSVPELSITTATTTTDTDAMKQWRSALAAVLDNRWKASQTEGTAGREVRISFYISVGGSISNVKVVQSSGIGELDSIARGTVQGLLSFQPPPSGKGETVTVLLKVE